MPHTHDIVAILNAIGPLVTAVPAIIGAFIAFMSYNEARTAKRLGEKNAAAIEHNTNMTTAIQKQTDGIQSALLAATEAKARLQGREEQRFEHSIGASEKAAIAALLQKTDRDTLMAAVAAEARMQGREDLRTEQQEGLDSGEVVQKVEIHQPISEPVPVVQIVGGKGEDK